MKTRSTLGSTFEKFLLSNLSENCDEIRFARAEEEALKLHGWALCFLSERTKPRPRGVI